MRLSFLQVAALLFELHPDKPWLSSLGIQRLDFFRQAEVFFCDGIARVMRPQGERQLVVDVVNLRVVVHALRLKRQANEERNRIPERGKPESFSQRIIFVGPPRQGGEFRLKFVGVYFFAHKCYFTFGCCV